MPTQISDYQCPSCTGPLHFDSASGMMKCDYCGSTYTVADVEAMYAAANAQAENAPEKEVASDSWGEDGKNMAAYSCPNCGAELIYENTVAVSSCPYCGNNTVIPAQFKGALKPDYVIPFKVTKEEAIEKLKAHMKRYKLVPKEFTESHTLDETKSVYVPYWLFSAEVSGDHTFNAKQYRVWEDSYNRYTETSVYSVLRSGKTEFVHVPVDGSAKMDDTLMESIEPYDYSALTPFKAAYLAGFPTDRYDVTSEDAKARAGERMRASFESHMAGTVSGYDEKVLVNTTYRQTDKTPRYALMPLWLMHVTWEGKRYTYAINGQTGKTVGSLPMSKKSYWKWHLLFTAIFSVALLLLFLSCSAMTM